MTRKEIQKINKELKEFNNYYSIIPLKEINIKLKENGLILIQEDNTEWSGFLCGDNSQTTFIVGRYIGESETYEPIKNTMLSLSWYKMESGRYEIVTYLT